jgi:hypothetical protein
LLMRLYCYIALKGLNLDMVGSPHVYLVPGLGADERLFARLKWDEGTMVNSLKWIEPRDHERIEDYALRMAQQVDTSKPFVLAGVSLGGIISIEMAKHINPHKIIIISSIKTKKEKPPYFFVGYLFKNTVFISEKRKLMLKILVRVFFGNMSRRSFNVFRDMLVKTGEKQIKWAQNAIVGWNNTQQFENLVHIHGTADLVFPTLFLKKYIPIEGGTHYMVISKSREISRLLNDIIKN